MLTFRRLMNRTHSTQVVRNGSKHTAQLPNRDSILCISGESRDALDATDDLFNCFFRMNLAACSCAENKVISCQSTHLLHSHFFLTSVWNVIITTCLFLLISTCLINQCAPLLNCIRVSKIGFKQLFKSHQTISSFNLCQAEMQICLRHSSLFMFWPKRQIKTRFFRTALRKKIYIQLLLYS